MLSHYFKNAAMFLLIASVAFLSACQPGSIGVGEPEYEGYSADGRLHFILSYGGEVDSYSVSAVVIEAEVPEEYTIPSEYKGYPVTAVNSLTGLDGVRKITIQDGITSIADEACKDMQSLEEIILPSTLQIIGDRAFSGTGIRTLTIPASVIFSGQAIAENCPSLENVSIAMYRPERVWEAGWNTGIPAECIEYNYGKEGLSFISIGTDAAVCMGLPADSTVTEVVIPGEYEGSPVIAVMDYAFSNITTLKKVQLPDTVTQIGAAAFDGCTSLEDINLTGSIEVIYESAFRNCANLALTSLPEGISHIGETAFTLSGLNISTLPASVETVGREAFSSTKIQSITLPETLIDAGAKLFIGCYDLKTVYVPYVHNEPELWSSWDDSLPDGVIVKPIDDNKVYYRLYNEAISDESDDYYIVDGLSPDASITEVVIPSEYNGKPVTGIGQYAFSNCISVKSITIPETITLIDFSAFMGCASLEKITIPDSIDSLPQNLCYGCTSLESIDIPEEITSIPRSAFYGCSSLRTVNLPDSLDKIDDNAFKSCKALSSINLPENIVSIGEEAFAGSGLESIDIPASVEIVERWAFSGCQSLREINVAWLEGNEPAGWEGWDWGLPEGYSINYGAVADPGEEDPDNPGGGDLSEQELSLIQGALSNAMAALANEVRMAAYGMGAVPEGVSVDLDKILNNQPYTITMNNVEYNMDAASFVLCGSYDYSIDTTSFIQTEKVNLTEGTMYDGESHTASWIAKGGSAGMSTTEIVVDGVKLPDTSL